MTTKLDPVVENTYFDAWKAESFPGMFIDVKGVRKTFTENAVVKGELDLAAELDMTSSHPLALAMRELAPISRQATMKQLQTAGGSRFGLFGATKRESAETQKTTITPPLGPDRSRKS